MFEIRFQGLITHASVKDTHHEYYQRAVLYTVPQPNMHHLALLSVSYDDWDASSDPDDFGNTSPDTPRCYDLTGKTVTDLPTGPSYLPRKNLAGLPNLRDPKITSGSVLTAHSDVADGKSTTYFSIFDVPGGTLFIRNWFPDMARFGGADYPMPRTVVFSTKAAGNVTFTISGTGKKVVVKSDAIVYITNFPQDSDHMHVLPPHWEAMSAFFDQSSGAVTVRSMSMIVTTPPFPLGDVDDPHDTCTVPHELSVECSNSQFP